MRPAIKLYTHQAHYDVGHCEHQHAGQPHYHHHWAPEHPNEIEGFVRREVSVLVTRGQHNWIGKDKGGCRKERSAEYVRSDFWQRLGRRDVYSNLGGSNEYCTKPHRDGLRGQTNNHGIVRREHMSLGEHLVCASSRWERALVKRSLTLKSFHSVLRDLTSFLHQEGPWQMQAPRSLVTAM